MDGSNFEITFFNYPLIWDMILVQSLIGRKTHIIMSPFGNVIVLHQKGKKTRQSTIPILFCFYEHTLVLAEKLLNDLHCILTWYNRLMLIFKMLWKSEKLKELQWQDIGYSSIQNQSFMCFPDTHFITGKTKKKHEWENVNCNTFNSGN